MARKIVCKWKKSGQVLVNPDGQVWPCCYLCNITYEYTNSDKTNILFGSHRDNSHIFKEYYDNKDDHNIKKRTLQQILDSKWYSKTLPESWKSQKTALKQCKQYCTVKDD
jgi:hypothetical protein